ncbi:hypothetical protein TUN199_00554 [Pyrenophora tritici-repentis]|nr:hypothetical protein Alg130_00352 [Pyrenophora tritici-repentis]KAI0615430.1 hypothetical protein TUN205_00355 [Pyrenophora tritici-repentis]KAI0627487.1 hypothetical protein TUN199_00554 [Pyrenophora tritici-repentis]
MRFTAITVLLAIQSAYALIPPFPVGETPAQVLSSFLHAISNAGVTIPTALPISGSQSPVVPTPILASTSSRAACLPITSTWLQGVGNTTVPAPPLVSAPSLTAFPSGGSSAPTLHSPWQWPALSSAVTPSETLVSSLTTTTVTPSAVLPVPGSTSRHPAPGALLPFLSYYHSFHHVSPQPTFSVATSESFQTASAFTSDYRSFLRVPPHSSFITSTQAAADTSSAPPSSPKPSSTAIVIVPITPSLHATPSDKPTSTQLSKVYTSVQSPDPRCPYPYPGIHCGPPKTTVVTKEQKPTSTTKKAAEKTSGSGVVGCGAPFCGR